MKYNLIFSGIEQTQEYEEALVNFMQTELGIDDANSINLQNVHRLSRRNDGKLLRPRRRIKRGPKGTKKRKKNQSTNSIQPKLAIHS